MYKRHLFWTIIFLLSVYVKLNAQQTEEVQPQKTIIGVASWYSDKFDGRKTATGEIFRQNKFTAASNVFTFGTWLKVTNLRNKKSVWVRVNDRLHPKMKRVVDLTRAAAEKLGMIKSGVAKVKVESYGKVKPQDSINEESGE